MAGGEGLPQKQMAGEVGTKGLLEQGGKYRLAQACANPTSAFTAFCAASRKNAKTWQAQGKANKCV